MIQVMSDEEVQQAKKEMISWVTKEINGGFNLVYKILWQLKQYPEDKEEYEP